MIILGIHDGHNAGAALIKDGRVLSAISEERLNNIKNYSGPPLLSINEVFNIASVRQQDTDLIAVGCLVRVGPPYADVNWMGRLQVSIAPYLHSGLFASAYVKILHLFRETGDLKSYFSKIGLEGKPVLFIDHHRTHAACAYYQKPWQEETLIFTLDGSGDGLSATVSVGRDSQIKRIARSTFYDSLSNNLYSEITGYLGMKRWEHEYKIMGLAPYGKDDGLIEEFKKVIRINPRNSLQFQNTYGAYLYDVTKKLQKVLVGRRFDNIAWATQKYFEDLLVTWIRNSVEFTGIRNIACAGGSFLNVKANKKIREMPEIKKSFFYPAADDGGTPVGAALEAYAVWSGEKKEKPRSYPLTDIYYGREYNNDEIDSLIGANRNNVSARQYPQGIEKKMAELLSRGKIVARFNGRDEWGPRALGNRSILADPRNLKVIPKLNFAIKDRDFWMPFAASILEEDASLYLKNSRVSRYMIEAFDTGENAWEKMAASLHPADRTCRPQTVNSWNPGFRKILTEFKKLTGVSALLNTSFNLHGYPMVGTPGIALETFLHSGLDALAINNWLLVKKNQE